MGAEGFDQFSSFNHFIYLLFLDLAPILVNWSDNWEYGTDIGQIWADNRLALSQNRLSGVFDSIWILGEE